MSAPDLVPGPASTVVTYPPLFRRYLGTLVDGLLLLTLILTVPQFLQGEGAASRTARIALFLCLFLYEPVLTAFACTLGQRMMGMRVRRVTDPTLRLSLPGAYHRWVLKILLGFVSFFSMRFANRYRAIHDLASGSLMIDVPR